MTRTINDRLYFQCSLTVLVLVKYFAKKRPFSPLYEAPSYFLASPNQTFIGEGLPEDLIRDVQARRWSPARKWSQDRNWFHRKKLGMAWTPWKVYGWIHIFLIVLGGENTGTSHIKAEINNVKHTAQNTKLTPVDCINFSIRKRTVKRNMNLRRCLCHLINRQELFPVRLLYARPR